MIVDDRILRMWPLTSISDWFILHINHRTLKELLQVFQSSLICRISYFNTLLSQIPAGPVVELHHHQPVAQGLYGPIHAHDPPRAFCRHVQVVGDGSGRDFQHVVRSALIQEDLTQSWKERSRRTPDRQEGEVQRSELTEANARAVLKTGKLTSRSSGPRCPTWAAACRAAPKRWAACPAHRPDPSAATPATCLGPHPPWWQAWHRNTTQLWWSLLFDCNHNNQSKTWAQNQHFCQKSLKLFFFWIFACAASGFHSPKMSKMTRKHHWNQLHRTASFLGDKVDLNLSPVAILIVER